MKTRILFAALLAVLISQAHASIAYNIIADWQVNATEDNVLTQLVPVDQVNPTIWMNDPSLSPLGNLVVAQIGAGLSFNSGTHTLSAPGSSLSFNNAPARSTIVTTAAAANGFQVSSTRNASVSYSVTISTSASLTGGSSGYVVLEICATNSSTAGNWIEVSRLANGQSNGLIVGLTLAQVGGGCVACAVPAGYYARLRSVNVVTTGSTPTYTYNSGQEVLL